MRKPLQTPKSYRKDKTEDCIEEKDAAIDFPDLCGFGIIHVYNVKSKI